MLAAQGCARGDRVALLLPKGPMAIAAMIGALKADCSYTPLDTEESRRQDRAGAGHSRSPLRPGRRVDR